MHSQFQQQQRQQQQLKNGKQKSVAISKDKQFRV